VSSPRQILWKDGRDADADEDENTKKISPEAKKAHEIKERWQKHHNNTAINPILEAT
jgi:hypothetical protein